MGSINFQKSIEDEDNENNTGKDCEIDGGETTFHLIVMMWRQSNPRLYSSLDLSTGGLLRGMDGLGGGLGPRGSTLRIIR